MLIRGIRGWCLILGLIVGGAGTSACVGESPCEYTATCPPPPDSGLGEGSSSDDSHVQTESTNSETDTSQPSTEDTEPSTSDTEDNTDPVPTSFPSLPVLPVTIPPGILDEILDASTSSPDVAADGGAVFEDEPVITETDFADASVDEIPVGPVELPEENPEPTEPTDSELPMVEPPTSSSCIIGVSRFGDECILGP